MGEIPSASSLVSHLADELPMVYSELRQIAALWMARKQSGHALQPTALIREAWLRLESWPTAVAADLTRVAPPAVTASSANLSANAISIAINAIVVFNDGAAGVVSTATSTSLTVTFLTKPATAASRQWSP